MFRMAMFGGTIIIIYRENGQKLLCHLIQPVFRHDGSFSEVIRFLPPLHLHV